MKSVVDILDTVQKLTEEGKLVWESSSPTHFEVGLGKNKLTVWTWTDENDGSDGVSIALARADTGKTLDFVNANEFSVKYEKYMNIFSVARRSAFKIDEEITQIEDYFSSLSKK
jgi:hypothetical protein